MKFGDLNAKIYIYGASKKNKNQVNESKIEVKKNNCAIMPDSPFKSYWNLIVTALLLYTASYMPFRIAFIDETDLPLLYFDTCIDFLFILDVIINFFSAYEDPTVGVETRFSKIAISYVTSWFALDILSR